MKKKISLKEKIRRQKQSSDGTEYLDGAGGTFTMTKEKDGWSIDRSHFMNDDGTIKESVIDSIEQMCKGINEQ